MGSIYGSGRPRTAPQGSIYGSGRPRVAPAVQKPEKKKGWLDVVASVPGNFGREAADIITGIPGAVVPLAKFIAATPGSPGFGSEENQALVRGITDDYSYRYGPLVRGDFGEFGRRTAERPLSFLLDVVPVAAAASKGATVSRLAKPPSTSITLRSPGAIEGRPGAAVLEKPLVGSDLGRRMRAGTDSLLKRLPSEFAILGETQRYARAVHIRELKDYTRLKLRAAPRAARLRRLSQNEFIAANLMADFPLRADLDRYVASLREVEGAQQSVKLLTDPKVLRHYEKPTPKMIAYIEDEAKLLSSMEDLLPMGADALTQRQFLPTLLARGAKFEDDVLTAERPIPDMIEEIRGELAAAGRAEPRYRPQKSVDEKGGARLGVGGTAPQRSPIRQNQGVLQAMGRVAYDIDTLTPQYMRTIKWASYTDRHADLMAAARAVDVLPEGYVYVKRSLSERVPYTERTAGEFERRMEELIDADAADIASGPTRKNELTTTDVVDAAVDEQGRRLAVPEDFAKRIVGEYERGSRAARLLWDKPTDIWRAVVLNMRVGWLVNNLIGNTLLYLVKNAGPEGIKSYVRALGDVTPLLRNKQVRNSLTPEDMAELFPEHVQGTFMGTQTPTTGFAGKISRYSPTRPLRAADISYEQALRRAMATRLAKRNPKVKARLESMSDEMHDFGKAARETLDPIDVERISKQINDALGDFFSLNKSERGFLRRLAPFYAWYRAITLIMVKMPVDSPARTAIMANLGKIGAPYTQDFGLPWLQGSIPLDDEGHMLGTKAMNPYATVTDLGRATFADDWFGARQREGIFNPYGELLAKAVVGEGHLPERLWEGSKEMAMGLPPSRIAFPQKRASYVGDPRMREFYAYLGFPFRRVSPEVRARAPER